MPPQYRGIKSLALSPSSKFLKFLKPAKPQVCRDFHQFSPTFSTMATGSEAGDRATRVARRTPAGPRPRAISAVYTTSPYGWQRGLTKAIEALAKDVANKFGSLRERLNALEQNQQLTPQVQNSHDAIPLNTSTPAPEAQRPNVSETPGERQSKGLERPSWAERPVDEVPDYEQEIVLLGGWWRLIKTICCNRSNRSNGQTVTGLL